MPHQHIHALDYMALTKQILSQLPVSSPSRTDSGLPCFVHSNSMHAFGGLSQCCTFTTRIYTPVTCMSHSFIHLRIVSWLISVRASDSNWRSANVKLSCGGVILTVDSENSPSLCSTIKRCTGVQYDQHNESKLNVLPMTIDVHWLLNLYCNVVIMMTGNLYRIVFSIYTSPNTSQYDSNRLTEQTQVRQSFFKGFASWLTADLSTATSDSMYPSGEPKTHTLTDIHVPTNNNRVSWPSCWQTVFSCSWIEKDISWGLLMVSCWLPSQHIYKLA